MELGLTGKTVAITGGSKGIGKAIQEALLSEGAIVYDYSRTTGVDLMDAEELENMAQYMDRFDILINNLGGCGTCDYPDWRIAMDKNYGITNQLTTRYLQRKRHWGRVITIASIYGKEKGHNPWFTAAKAAQIAYMKSLSGRYPGITFNTICPGCIDTKPEIKEYAKKNKMSLGQPEDVANIVTFLCSNKASHINGASIPVDGGESHVF